VELGEPFALEDHGARLHWLRESKTLAAPFRPHPQS
jgi:hypothetical protein